MHLDDLHNLLGLNPSSPPLNKFLASLSGTSAVPQPEAKAYPDVLYHNYYDLGVSFCYIPASGSSIPARAKSEDLVLDSIDIYHRSEEETVPQRPGRLPKPTFNTFKGIPIDFPPVATAKDDSSATNPLTSFTLDQETIGKDLVGKLGEPTKKGGGIRGQDVYLEWPKLGVQIDLKDQGKEVTEEQKKRGLGGVWDKAAEWSWSCLKVFEKAI
jgi:hypothetical protein